MIENKEFVYVVIKDFIREIGSILSKSKNLKQAEELKISKLQSAINTYLEKTFLEFSYIKPLALLGESVELEKIYQPLTLENISVKTKVKDMVILDKFKLDIFKSTSRILIEDSAGMGKTTLLKFLFINYIKSKDLSKEFIPLFLEIRNFNNGSNLKDIIKNSFYGPNSEVTPEVIESLFEQKLLVFFDGFDEIIESKKEQAINEINDFTSKYNLNLYILTSRSDQILSNIAMYEKYKIKPLQTREAIKLLKKYDNIATDEKGTISSLIKEIRCNQKIIESFLTNPLLTSLLYRAYIYKKNIPISKSEFYNQVYNALYEEHDVSTKKGFNRNVVLNKYDLQKILSNFSFLNIKDLTVEFSENELIEKIENVKQRQNIQFNTTELITNLYREVPLFIKEGRTYYWGHKSFQEYFIALKINSLAKREQFIEKLIFNKNIKIYINILEFLYDLDSKLFLRLFLKKVNLKITEFFNLSDSLDTDTKEKLFLYPKAYLYIVKKYIKEQECGNKFNELVKINEDFGTSDQRGIIHLYRDKTSFLRVNCSNFYEIFKILSTRKVDIFKNQTFKTSSENILKNFDENKFYMFDENDLSYFNEIQELIKNDFGENYFLLDFDKIDILLKQLEKEEKEEKERELEILEYL